MVGFGGIAMTFGWNQFDNYDQKNALIQAVANEWLINEFSLPCKNLPYDPNNKELGKKHHLYPIFKSSAMSVLLTSNLLTLDSEEDRELILQVMRYEDRISSLNYILRRIDNECIMEGIDQEARRQKYYNVNESKILQNYHDSHRAMKELLYDKFNWALSQRLGEHLQQFKERRPAK